MKRLPFLILALIGFAGCSDRDVRPVAPVVSALERPGGDVQRDSAGNELTRDQDRISATGNERESNALADDARVGTVARVEIDDQAREDDLNDQLHFCVFDNEDHDTIYVGTKYGMWSHGEFDLEIGGQVVFTGSVPPLLYQGVVLDMGNVLDGQPPSNIGVHISRVTGILK